MANKTKQTPQNFNLSGTLQLAPIDIIEQIVRGDKLKTLSRISKFALKE